MLSRMQCSVLTQNPSTFFCRYRTVLRLCSWDKGHESLGSHRCWRPRIEARRHVCHCFLDYALAYVAASTLPLLILLPSSSSFSRMPPALIATSMIGGCLLALGNLSFQWATVVFRAPLTTILALQASLTVILGTSLNYILEPQQTPHPEWLLAGVIVFLAAIGFATLAQCLYATTVRGGGGGGTGTPNHISYTAVLELPYGSLQRKESDAFTVVDTSEDVAMAPAAAETYHHHHNVKGLLVAFAGGLCFGFFSPAFNIAVNDPFGWTKSQQSQGEEPEDRDTQSLVFTVNMWFSLAFFITSWTGNLLLLHSETVWTHNSAWSTLHILWNYLTQGSWNDRRVALGAGLVCAAGNVLQFHGYVSTTTGFACIALPLLQLPHISSFLDARQGTNGRVRHL